MTLLLLFLSYLKFHINHLIAGFTFDSLNSSKMLIHFPEYSLSILGYSSLTQLLKSGFDDPIVQLYYKLLVKGAVLFGANKKRAEKEMKEVVELEIKLANFTLPPEQKRNLSTLYHPLPLSEVQKLFPEVPLVQYIKAIIGVEVTEEEVVNVETPAFITKEIYP